MLPLTAVPLTVGRPRSVQLVDDVMRGNPLLALVAERDVKSDPGPEDLHRIGTVGAIHQLHRVPDGTVRLMVQGIERIRLVDFTGTEPYLVARVEVLKDQTDQATEVDALRRAVVDVFRRLVEASAEMPDEMATAAENLSDPRHVAYFVAAVVPIDVAARQELLELDPVSAKLRRLIDLLQRELRFGSSDGRSPPRPRSGSPRSSASTICASSSGPSRRSWETSRSEGAKERSSAAASRRRACPTRRGARRSAS